ncbi:MAG: hypothetical protein H5T69_00050 [Chloroflexi bacterium]|nr:hypothetical protein [Chloroflexota bacterium]
MGKGIRLLVLSLLSVLLLGQVGCCCCTWATPVRRNPILDRFRGLGAQERIVSRSNAEFDLRSDTQVFDYELKRGMSGATLEAVFRLRSGALRWTLTDPLGMVRWQGTAEGPGTVRDRKRFPPVPGVWKLEIRFNRASGSYDIAWEAR